MVQNNKKKLFQYHIHSCLPQSKVREWGVITVLIGKIDRIRNSRFPFGVAILSRL